MKFLQFWDVFGAKPSLAGPPKNYSVIGCLLTVLITVLAILTFVMTLKNMGAMRTYMDQTYVKP